MLIRSVYSSLARPLRLALPAAASFVLVTATQADALIEYDVDTDRGRDFSQVYIANGKVAVTQTSLDGHSWFDAGSSTFTIVDHGQKSYIVMTEAKIEQAISMASSVMGAVSSAMEGVKSLPKEQQQAAEALLKSLGIGSAAPAPPRTAINATGKRLNVSGVICSVYRVTKGNQAIGDACLASESESGIAATDWQTLTAMRTLWLKYADRATPLLERFGAGLPDVTAARLNGLPLMITEGPRRQLMLRRIAVASMPRELVTVPPGYVERNLPAM